MKNPPKFHFSELAQIVSPAPLLGGLLVAVPVAVVTQMVLAWFIYNPSPDPVNSPHWWQFEKQSGSVLVNGALTLDQIVIYRSGRAGSAMFFVGMYFLLVSADALIPEGSGGKYHWEDFIGGGAGGAQDSTLDDDGGGGGGGGGGGDY